VTPRVDEATRIVTLDRDVPAASSTVPATHASGGGTRPPTSTPAACSSPSPGTLDLEDGVQVTFGGADFRTGDWWAFAATNRRWHRR
jgi:hypothetical protein